MIWVRLLFLSFIVLIGYSNTDAQTPDPSLQRVITVSLRNVKLSKALKIIEHEADVRFSYSKKRIDVSKLITYQAKNVTVSEVLDAVLIPAGIEYVLVEKQIVLRPLKAQTVAEVTPLETASIKKSERYTLSGFVRDSATGEVLIGATVHIPKLSIGAMTNTYGYYSLTMPEGTYSLIISYIGYKKNQQILRLTKDMVLDQQLEHDTEILQEIIVESRQNLNPVEQVQIVQADIQPSAVQQMPALLGEVDVVKSFQAIPGIKLYSDGSTMMHVRGGDRDQNLIVLDEATIYNPSHLLGLFSTIIPEASKDIKIYKGNLPVQNGGRLSSVIDIQTKDGNMNKFGMSGSIGLISTRLSAEGPIVKDRSSYFVSGRLSHLKWFMQKLAPNTSDLFFYDLNGKINFKLGQKDRDRLFFSFYSGRDYYSNEGNSGVRWGNFAGTIRWNHVFNKKLFSNTTLYTSVYDYDLITNIANNDRWNSHIANLSLKSDFTYFANPNLTAVFGMALRWHNFNPGNYEPGSGGVQPGVPYVPRKYAREWIVYGGNEHTFSNRISIQYGFRFSLWQNVGATTEYTFIEEYEPTGSIEYGAGETYRTDARIEPRLSVTYLFDRQYSMNFYYNRTVQNIHMITNSISPFTNFEVWLPSGPNIAPQLGDILGLGVVRQFGEKGWEINLEGYYKWLDNQIDYKDHAEMILNPLIEGELRFGKGWSYGGEFTLKKSAGKISGWLGYAYSRATRKIEGVNDSETFSTFWDRPHEVNLFLNYKINPRLSLATQWIYNTGAPITTPSSYYEYDGLQVPIYSERSNQRLPDYHRLDLSLDLRLNKQVKRFNHHLNFSIYNFYGRKNPVTINFNKIQTGQDVVKVPGDLFPPPAFTPSQTFIYSIIPSISYRFNL